MGWRDRLVFFALWPRRAFRGLQPVPGRRPGAGNGFCGGATVSPEVLLFFWILGVPVYQIYGMTETGGRLFAHTHAAAGRDAVSAARAC